MQAFWCSERLPGVLAEDVDHSMEGQISKPQSSGESDTDSFVDDSTDNTYGYYTIMGCTTVDVEDMVAQYEAQNVEYPSDVLTEGGDRILIRFARL